MVLDKTSVPGNGEQVSLIEVESFKPPVRPSLKTRAHAAAHTELCVQPNKYVIP